MASQEPGEEATQAPGKTTPQPTPETSPTAATGARSEPAAPTHVVDVEDAPDPDEDDLDDLDDVLDEFAATVISKPAPAASGPGRPVEGDSATAGPVKPSPGGGPGNLFADDDEFAKSLQQGMAELLGEFDQNPIMQKQFEDLVKELGEGMTAAQEADPTMAQDTTSAFADVAGSGASAGSKDLPKPGASFEETIRATMERMQSSNASASQASAQAADVQEDFMATMLRQLEQAGPEGLGLGGDEDFSKVLLGMMEQLTNKDILYEPMKELHDKFPAWMKENEGKVKDADWKRYQEQQTLVAEIVDKFEESGYSDDKAEYRDYIVKRMQQMQEAGSPPPDLVGDMDAATSALGDLDSGCPQQ